MHSLICCRLEKWNKSSSQELAMKSLTSVLVRRLPWVQRLAKGRPWTRSNTWASKLEASYNQVNPLPNSSLSKSSKPKKLASTTITASKLPSSTMVLINRLLPTNSTSLRRYIRWMALRLSNKTQILNLESNWRKREQEHRKRRRTGIGSRLQGLVILWVSRMRASNYIHQRTRHG